MSDVQARPSAPRGRASSRGARPSPGFRGGGGGGGRRAASRPKFNGGDQADHQTLTVFEDEGELGQLKMKYSEPLIKLKELFPDWTDDDLVFALQETDGDLESTVERISEGIAVLTSAPVVRVIFRPGLTGRARRADFFILGSR